MRQSEERYISLLTDLDKRPKALKEKIFTKLFAEAEIAKFNPKELREYEDSLKAYRDIKNSLDTAKEQGKAEGIEIGKMSGKAEEKRDTALRLLGMGLTLEQVAAGTQLTVEGVKELIK